MNSSIISISEILNNVDKLASTGFSGGYNFDEVNAAEYFDDLIENSLISDPIFSGILIAEKAEKSENELTIIDGLQRIITINLLLCALCENYKNISKKNEEAKNKVFNRYLVINNEPKLKLTGEEQELYKKILFSQELTKNEKATNLVKAYKSFLDKIREHKISGTDLFKIISKIQFMLVTTDKSEVSIRELYLTINSNKEKTQINLISDFIKHKNKSAGLLWQEILESYKELGDNNIIEEFVSDFLTVQNDSKIADKNALYSNFKIYFNKILKYQNTEKIIKNLCQYARHYLKIITADFEDYDIKEQIISLNENKGQDSYPYLMEALDDLENGHINKEVFLDILMMINSFVKNRQEISISDITIDFASLSKELNKMLVLKNYIPKIIDENKLTINKINNFSTFEV